MKARTPVDLQRIGVQPRAPRAQAVDRDVVCCGVIFGTTPLQFSASTCIAQNAWTALLRLSVDSGSRVRLRRLRASSRADTSRFSALSQRSNVLLVSRWSRQ
jgi:hypothetical protein